MWDSWRQLEVEKQSWDCRRASKHVRTHTTVVKTSFSSMCPPDLKLQRNHCQRLGHDVHWERFCFIYCCFTHQWERNTHTPPHIPQCSTPTTRLRNSHATTLIRVKRDGWIKASLNSSCIQKQTWLAQGRRCRETQLKRKSSRLLICEAEVLM